MKNILLTFIITSLLSFGINYEMDVECIDFNQKIHRTNSNIIEIETTSIIITIKSEFSKDDSLYNEINDFSEINCLQLENINGYYSDYLNACDNSLFNLRGTDYNFNRILKVEVPLDEYFNFENIKSLLLSREDIYCVNEDTKLNLLSDSFSEPVKLEEIEGVHYQWALENIELEEAINMYPNIRADLVKVGVFDTGIGYNETTVVDNLHPDLSWMLDDVCSTNFSTFEPNSDVRGFKDVENHGTLIAGIIGAIRNDFGVDGITNSCRLVSLKANISESSSNNDRLTSQLIRALEFARNNSIYLINMSFGSSVYNESMKTAISNFPGLVVCGAGNSNKNTDLFPTYPASFDLDNIISVGAIKSDNSIWVSGESGSNYGATTIDIFAPGHNIVSTDNTKGYSLATGTSFATPHVTGVAAMLMAYNYELGAELTIQELIQLILDSSIKENSLVGKCVSGGRLSAYNAMKNLHPDDFSYVYNSQDTHRVYCSTCGFTDVEEHDWVIPSLNGVISNYAVPIRLICSKCGVAKIV